LAILTVRCFLKVIQALEKLKLLGAICWWLDWMTLNISRPFPVYTHARETPSNVRPSFLFILRLSYFEYWWCCHECCWKHYIIVQ
jgi:hypothetical protein